MAAPPRTRFDEGRDDAGMNDDVDLYDEEQQGKHVSHRIIRGPPLESLLAICPNPPEVFSMKEVVDKTFVFMVKPFKYDPAKPTTCPEPVNGPNRYIDVWDDRHVRMPCSRQNTDRHGQPRWPNIQRALAQLKKKCDQRTAVLDDLKKTIEFCAERTYNFGTLEYVFNEVYSSTARGHFMSDVLSHICKWAMNVDAICSRPPPLLRAGSDGTVVMAQYQAASLLACAFFCLFPLRHGPKMKKEYEHFPRPNFNALYLRGERKTAEKLVCILHYFKRIAEEMPNGTISFRRYTVPDQLVPKWSESKKNIAPMHMTTSKKIEDVDCTLQVDFANMYIGGGVLDTGCVQEEIRFTICPEMIVSMLVCERMLPNECIFLVGCERFSTYKGYSKTFRFAEDYIDTHARDDWGRRWSRLVAIDALYFAEPASQFDKKHVKRELLKAYAGFHSRTQSRNDAYPITTGNWGCGAFNGDRQLKAMIQLIVASEVERPLIYAAYGDKNLIEQFAIVFDYLVGQRATVRDMYRYLKRYCETRPKLSVFDFILQTPVVKLPS